MFPRIQFWTESCVRSILHRIDEFLPLGERSCFVTGRDF